jgi:hypothetical protein
MLGNIRGRCSVCNVDVYDTQARQKDRGTGLYLHEACSAASAGGADLTLSPADAGAARANEVASSSCSSSRRNITAATASEATEAAVIAAENARVVDAARAEAIKESMRQAQEAIAPAQVDAAKIVAASAANGGGAVLSAIPEPAPPTVPILLAAPTKQPVLSPVPKPRMVLPDGKHAFLSYQWDVQAQVVQIKGLLNERNVKCWMDIDGGMKTDIYDSVRIGLLYTHPFRPHSLLRTLALPCGFIPLLVICKRTYGHSLP